MQTAVRRPEERPPPSSHCTQCGCFFASCTDFSRRRFANNGNQEHRKKTEDDVRESEGEGSSSKNRSHWGNNRERSCHRFHSYSSRSGDWKRRRERCRKRTVKRWRQHGDDFQTYTTWIIYMHTANTSFSCKTPCMHIFHFWTKPQLVAPSSGSSCSQTQQRTSQKMSGKCLFITEIWAGGRDNSRLCICACKPEMYI